MGVSLVSHTKISCRLAALNEVVRRLVEVDFGSLDLALGSNANQQLPRLKPLSVPPPLSMSLPNKAALALSGDAIG